MAGGWGRLLWSHSFFGSNIFHGRIGQSVRHTLGRPVSLGGGGRSGISVGLSEIPLGRVGPGLPNCVDYSGREGVEAPSSVSRTFLAGNGCTMGMVAHCRWYVIRSARRLHLRRSLFRYAWVWRTPNTIRTWARRPVSCASLAADRKLPPARDDRAAVLQVTHSRQPRLGRRCVRIL